MHEYSYFYKQTSTRIFLNFYNYYIMTGCDNSEWVIQREVNIWLKPRLTCIISC